MKSERHARSGSDPKGRTCISLECEQSKRSTSISVDKVSLKKIQHSKVILLGDVMILLHDIVEHTTTVNTPVLTPFVNKKGLR